MMQWIAAKWITKSLHVAAELGVADLNNRCQAILFDFMTETPPACDAYFLVNVRMTGMMIIALK